MRALLLVTILVASGCIGLPEGSIDTGDDVRISFVALHADTGVPLYWSLDTVTMTDVDGEPYYDGASLRARVQSAISPMPAELSAFFVPDGFSLAAVEKYAFDQALVAGGHTMAFAESTEFVVGHGTSPLGGGAELQLLGAMPGDELRFTVREDASRAWTGQQSVPKNLGDPEPIGQEIGIDLYTANLGEPEVGFQFPYNDVFDAIVRSWDNDTVYVDLAIEDGDEFPVDIIGGDVVARVADGMYRFEIVLREGATFDVRSTAFNPGPLGLPRGGYRAMGTVGDDVVWQYATVPGATVGMPVEYIVRVEATTQNIMEPTEDLGVRVSPVLVPIGHTLGNEVAVAEDDGHDGHDGHQH